MNVDRALFDLVNVQAGNPVFDAIMPVASEFRYFIPAFLLLAFWLAMRRGRTGRMTLLLLALTLPATDQIASHLLKPAFSRPRPCRAEAGLERVVVRARCSGRGSFPSSHAANMAGVAVLFLLRHRRLGWVFLGGAGVVGASRVYLGVHYPSDVAGGYALGSLVALLLALAGARWEARRGRPDTGLRESRPAPLTG